MLCIYTAGAALIINNNYNMLYTATIMAQYYIGCILLGPCRDLRAVAKSFAPTKKAKII